MNSTTPKQEAISPTIPSSQMSDLGHLLKELQTRKSTPGSQVGANISDALATLQARGLRSFLTLLSIFVGIAAVVVSLIWTQGASASLNNQLIGLGTTVISVTPGSPNDTGTSDTSWEKQLTIADAQSLHAVAHVIDESPVISVPGVQVVYSNQNWNTSVDGVNVDFQSIQNWQLTAGSWFSPLQEAQGKPVAVLGATVAKQLFGNQSNNAVTQQLRIGSNLFTVVGILTPKGGSAAQDDIVFVPVQTALVRLKNTSALDGIQIEVDTMNNLGPAQQGIRRVLRHSHHIPNGTPDDFTITTADQLIQSAQQQNMIISLLSVGIATISLTVAGLGIMNIMFVSVTERTREIGIRISIGARRRDIRNQFLAEALVLCLIGGLLGLLLGLLIGALVDYMTGQPFVVTITTLLLPFGISTGLALIFGLYPAIRASHLDPIKAIRGAAA